MVIADTSVWIPFFARPDAPEKRTLDRLIDTREVALVGVVLAEVLQGTRTAAERHQLAQALLALPYLEVTQATWMRAGDLSTTLLRRGVSLPLSDLVVAALALEHGCRVFTLDRHFRRVPGLSLYTLDSA